MLVLGLETSTAQSSVCLATEEGLVAEAALGAQPSQRTGGRGPAHGEFLMPAVAFCLDEAHVDVSALSGVAVGLGPGLYTGMRVGIAAAQALAQSRQLPVVGLPSLDVVAAAGRFARSLVASVVDARRSEVFWAIYRPGPDGPARVSDMRVGPATELAGQLEAQQEDVLCLGDGVPPHRDELEAAGATVDPAAPVRPHAHRLVELAVPRFREGRTQRPEDLRPVYLRQADARINWRDRGALFGGEGGC